MVWKKATRNTLKRDNRQLLLRAVYTGLANSRADLAHETGLAKPTVSELIKELIDEGYLIETGLGNSTDEGGKRPRLLEYLPDARHIIGVSLTMQRVVGILANLDGDVLAQHQIELADADGAVGDPLERLLETINGLIAQLTAPLLCISVGTPGLVDSRRGVIHDVAQWGWKDLSLSESLQTHYQAPVYVANNTELAAMAQYAFGDSHAAANLVTVLVEDSVGVGIVLDGAAYQGGGEIGQLRLDTHLGSQTTQSDSLGEHLDWPRVRAKLEAAVRPLYPVDRLMYLHLRQAVVDNYPAALALRDELAGYLAPVFAWIIALLRPEHIALVGPIADLGESLLDCVIEKAGRLTDPALVMPVTFSLDSRANLAALGAVAFALQQELGLI